MGGWVRWGWVGALGTGTGCTGSCVSEQADRCCRQAGRQAGRQAPSQRSMLGVPSPAGQGGQRGRRRWPAGRAGTALWQPGPALGGAVPAPAAPAAEQDTHHNEAMRRGYRCCGAGSQLCAVVQAWWPGAPTRPRPPVGQTSSPAAAPAPEYPAALCSHSGTA